MAKYDTHRELSELVSISESKALLALLETHKKHLQGEVNRFIREQNLIEAYGSLGKLDDINKILGLIKKRIFEIRKEKSNG